MNHRLAVSAALILLPAPAFAAVPVYSGYRLEARSNIVNGFNLLPTASFNSASPTLNADRRIAIKLVTVGSSSASGLFAGFNAVGGPVYTAPTSPVVSDASINAAGVVVFEQYDLSGSHGIFRYDPGTGMTNVVVSPGGPFGHTFLGSPRINNSGAIAFRGQTAGAHGFVIDQAGVQTRYVAQVELQPGSPYSFLFTPAFNNNNQIAGKVRLGSAGQTGNNQPDEIRLWSAPGVSTLIAVDRDGDITSPYSGFDNSVSVNDNGQVAFIANLVAGGRGVFVSDGVTTTTIAQTGVGPVGTIEFFWPAINNAGLVVFRARDAANLYTILVGDGTSLTRIVTEHDLLPSDLGTARVDQHDSSVVFGGNPAINARGDAAFAAALTPPENNQIEWGTGLYIALAGRVGDLNGDGAVGPADLGILLGSWGNPGCGGAKSCAADLNGDGAVGPADLGILLGNWGG